MTMTLIDEKGVRPICRECAERGKAALHKAENCPLARRRRQRERESWDRWLAKMIQMRDQIAERQAARA